MSLRKKITSGLLLDSIGFFGYLRHSQIERIYTPSVELSKIVDNSFESTLDVKFNTITPEKLNYA